MLCMSYGLYPDVHDYELCCLLLCSLRDICFAGC